MKLKASGHHGLGFMKKVNLDCYKDEKEHLGPWFQFSLMLSHGLSSLLI